jgi:hypothetical protein
MISIIDTPLAVKIVTHSNSQKDSVHCKVCKRRVPDVKFRPNGACQDFGYYCDESPDNFKHLLQLHRTI